MGFLFFPPRRGIPASEIGPAQGPMPDVLLPDAPVTNRIAPVGARLVERPDRERDRQTQPRPMDRGPRVTPDFIRQLGNVAGNLVNNLIQAAVLRGTGPLAPVVAPIVRPVLPVIRPTPPPITTPIMQPEPTVDKPTVPREGGVTSEGRLTREREREFVERARSEIIGGATAEARQAARERLHEDIRREFGV